MCRTQLTFHTGIRGHLTPSLPSLPGGYRKDQARVEVGRVGFSEKTGVRGDLHQLPAGVLGQGGLH